MGTAVDKIKYSIPWPGCPHIFIFFFDRRDVCHLFNACSQQHQTFYNYLSQICTWFGLNVSMRQLLTKKPAGSFGQQKPAGICDAGYGLAYLRFATSKNIEPSQRMKYRRNTLGKARK